MFICMQKSIEFQLPLYEIPQLSSPYCVLIFDSNFNCRNWKMRKKCHPLRPFPMYGDRRNLTNHLLQSRKVNKYISVHKSGFCRLFTTCKQSFFFPFLYTFLSIYLDLYEGLKLAQRGRLEDQRGTEIKFEMPEFLKRGTVSYSANLS